MRRCQGFSYSALLATSAELFLKGHGKAIATLTSHTFSWWFLEDAMHKKKITTTDEAIDVILSAGRDANRLRKPGHDPIDMLSINCDDMKILNGTPSLHIPNIRVSWMMHSRKDTTLVGIFGK